MTHASHEPARAVLRPDPAEIPVTGDGGRSGTTTRRWTLCADVARGGVGLWRYLPGPARGPQQPWPTGTDVTG